VDTPCGGQANAVNGFKELLFTMRVGESGGQISSAEIDYNAEGREHTLLVDWQMVALRPRRRRRDLPWLSASEGDVETLAHAYLRAAETTALHATDQAACSETDVPQRGQ
jgi:hypothetical protein